MFTNVANMLFNAAMVARNNAAMRAAFTGLPGQVVRGGVATHVVLHPRTYLRHLGDAAVGVGHGLAHMVGRGYHARAVAPVMAHDLELANSLGSAISDGIIDTTAQVVNQPDALHALGNNLDVLQQATENGFRAIVNGQKHILLGGLAIGGLILLGHKFLSSRAVARQILSTQDVLNQYIANQAANAIEATVSNAPTALVPVKDVGKVAPFLTAAQVTVMVIILVLVVGSVCIVHLYLQYKKQLPEVSAGGSNE